jgi:histone deacetylase 6
MRKRQPATKKLKTVQFVDYYDKAKEARDCVKGKTGIVYHKRNAEDLCLWYSSYAEETENPQPIESNFELELIDRCQRVPSRPASEEEILELHTEMKDEVIRNKSSLKYDDIFTSLSIYKMALLAAGSTIDLICSIVKGEVMNGMDLVPPFEEHAMPNEKFGYLFFNNVANAAKHAIGNLNVKRVTIIDYDGHHVRSTQFMFDEDPRALYISVHRFWPKLKESKSDYSGFND